MSPNMVSTDLIQSFTAMDSPRFNAVDSDAPKSDSEDNMDKLVSKTVFVM